MCTGTNCGTLSADPSEVILDNNAELRPVSASSDSELVKRQQASEIEVCEPIVVTQLIEELFRRLEAKPLTLGELRKALVASLEQICHRQRILQSGQFRL